MKITIPFNAWSKDKLKNNLKTSTSRTKKYGITGDYFIVDNQHYIITSVVQKTLQDIAYNHYKEEGASSPEEFIKVWKDIIGDFIDNQIVQFHKFKPISEPPQDIDNIDWSIFK